MAIIKHPAAQKRAANLYARFFKVRKEHEAAVNRMWAGTLATNFTDEELGIIKDLLSPNDHALMARVRDPLSKRRA